MEIVSARSATETLYVNPTGTYTREIASAPVRVKKGGVWTPIDLSLVASEGGLVPKAASGDVVLSAGGSGPLLELTIGGVNTKMFWPLSLPEPIVDGSTATYGDVFAGVDLKMTVTDAGVSQVLVVKDAEAASNPALRSLRLATEVEGGSLEGADGGFEILDETGRMVGLSPKPAMWDSTGTVLNKDAMPVHDESAVAIEQRVSGPAEGDEITPIALDVTAEALTLRPQSAALSGANVAYPLYVDPSAGSSAFQWAMAFKENPNLVSYKWTDANGQGVGHQNYNGVSTKRLFFQHSISSLYNSQIVTATFKARMVWSASCTTRTIRLYRGGEADSKTTWNNQPSWGEYQGGRAYSAGWSACNPSGRDVVWDVKNAVTDAVAEDRPTVAFGMRAADETDPLTWRRFLHTTSISVVYNRAPSVPSPRSIADVSCPASTVVRLGKMTSAPIIKAGLKDPDGDNVRARIQWNTGSSVSSSSPELINGYIASGSTATRSFPVSPVNGTIPSGTWSFRVRAQDPSPATGMNGVVSAYSDECTFTIDSTAAATPIFKNIPGQVDPSLRWEVNKAYNVELWPGGTPADTVGYRFSVNDDQPPTSALLPATGSNYTYVKSQLFSDVGLKTLRLWAYDAVGNRSDYPAVHQIEVLEPSAGARSTYSFDEPDGSAALDSTRSFPLDLGDAERTKRGSYVDQDPDVAIYDGMVRLDPTMVQLPSAASNVVDQGRSFTVAALLDPAVSDTAQAMTAVSYAGAGGAAFELGVEPNEAADGFAYVVKVWDTSTNAWVKATVGVDDGQPGTRQVIASFDAINRNLTILAANPDGTWDEGRSPDGVTVTPPATLTDPSLLVGADTAGGGRWNGYVDNLVLAQGVLNGGEQDELLVRSTRTTECYYLDGGC